MTTTISKKIEINEPIEKVWTYLIDPEKIVVCVPGAFLSEKIDDRSFKGGVALKLGPVKAKFDGEVTFTEVDEANKSMTLKGKGLDSKGKGSATMLMKSILTKTDTGTLIDCSMELSIVGKLAQFGSRLINDVSDQLFNQFINNFKAKLAVDTTSNTGIGATNSAAEAVSTATATLAVPKTSVQETMQAPAVDNSLNAFSLMMAVIKGWFSRLFGGGK